MAIKFSGYKTCTIACCALQTACFNFNKAVTTMNKKYKDIYKKNYLTTKPNLFK